MSDNVKGLVMVFIFSVGLLLSGLSGYINRHKESKANFTISIGQIVMAVMGFIYLILTVVMHRY